MRAKLGPSENQIIALEPSGGYEWAVWEMLASTGYDIRQVYAAHVRAFTRANCSLVKTDPIDTRLIAEFIVFRPQPGPEFPEENIRVLNNLSAKRRQIVEIRERVKC